jgi:hypothetical protein
MRCVLISALLVGTCLASTAQGALIDSDHDGVTDAEELTLLQQFLPRFIISSTDCSIKPAEFTPFSKDPVAAADNGVIYGQVFPLSGRAGGLELHYYDLWRKDCGESAHNLDAEHVSVLIGREETGKWKARYWYAAAHEDTVCNASQIARAQALNAVDQGAEVWISTGKHAAFLSKAVCKRGCGADSCEGQEQLSNVRVVNLGELPAPMNGATWAASSLWRLSVKMGRSDFDPALTARMESLPADEIAWTNPGKRPTQAVILGADAALDVAETGMRATDSALTVADTKSSGAMDVASKKTGNALAKSYRGVLKALRVAGGSRKPEQAK